MAARVAIALLSALTGLSAPLLPTAEAPERAVDLAQGTPSIVGGWAVLEPADLAASVPSRLDAATPVAVGIRASRERFADGRATHAVLSRDDTWPDALAAAPLTAEGPLLFTASAELDPDTLAEIRRVLGSGGTVYLLGGTSALSLGVELSLRQAGFTPRRLAGAGRTDTAVAIAEEVARLYPDSADELIVARARGTASSETAGWADSVSGSAYAARQRIPVVVTDTAALDPVVASYIQRHQPTTTWILGGTSAVSRDVEANVPNPRRVYGRSRSGTAAAIVTDLWGRDNAAGFLLVNGHREDGWAFGLAAAGLGADEDAPILLVNDGLPPETAELLQGCGGAPLPVGAVGSSAQVSAAVLSQAQATARESCARLASSYAFMASNPDGAAVRYNPCEPVEFEVNLAGAPPNAVPLIRAALDEAATVSGLEISLVSFTSTERMASPQDAREYRDPAGGFRPVLINWPVAWGNDPAYGYGGSASLRFADGSRQYVSGLINLNAAMPAYDGSLEHVITHEIGHVLGIAHVQDDVQLMFPYTQPRLVDYQAGDRAGLQAVGRPAGCLMAADVAARVAVGGTQQHWPDHS